MILALHQPEYLPWTGFFSKMLKSDVFVIYDDAKYVHGDFHNRNRIKDDNEWQWLSVPCTSDHKCKLKDVKIDNSKNWKEKHWNAIQINYGRYAGFVYYKGLFESIYKKEWIKLMDLDIEIINQIRDILNIKTKIINSSDLNAEGISTDKIINICKKMGADTYLSGTGARGYLEEKKFEDNGIKLTFNEIQKGWSNLSIIDSIFRFGREETRCIL